MNYNYNNYKVLLPANVVDWTNTGAGTVGLVWAADVPSLDHSAAANTPVLELNIAAAVRKARALPASTGMKIKSVSVGVIIGTAALTSVIACEGHKLSVSTTTGLVTSATVAITDSIAKAITTGLLTELTFVDSLGEDSPVEISAYDDLNLELTAVCAATSALKITSLIVDVDILDS